MTSILTLTTNPTVDLGLEVESLESSGKNRATISCVAAGGGGINVACAVVELGGDAVAIHTAGAETGSRLERLLNDEPISHVAVEIAGETREAIVLTETSTGHSYHVVPAGPEVSAAEADAIVDAVTEHAAQHDLVVVSGSLPPGLQPDFYARLATALAADGSRLMLDPSGADLAPSLDQGMYVVKLNRREAAGMAGGLVESFEDAIRANEYVLHRRWATIAATTIGDLGAVVSSETTHHEIHTPELPRPVRSDAGAGDSFMAGLALGLGQGLDVGDAGALAVASASASVMTPGTELCQRDDVEQLRPRVGIVRRDVTATDADQEEMMSASSRTARRPGDRVR